MPEAGPYGVLEVTSKSSALLLKADAIHICIRHPDINSRIANTNVALDLPRRLWRQVMENRNRTDDKEQTLDDPLGIANAPVPRTRTTFTPRTTRTKSGRGARVRWVSQTANF